MDWIKAMVRSRLSFDVFRVLLIGVLLACGCGQLGPFRNHKAPYDLGGDEIRDSEKEELAVPWLDSWELASSQAESEHKLVVACFTGSDWCNWCKRLEAEVFDTAIFDAWASEHAVLLKLDFPRHSRIDPAIKRQNEELAKRYTDHIGGYPTVLILTPDGTVVGELGFVAGGPDAWIREASRFLAAPSAGGP